MTDSISDEMYEHFREILEKQNKRTYTIEEAKEIGNDLLDFFMLLESAAGDHETKEST